MICRSSREGESEEKFKMSENTQMQKKMRNFSFPFFYITSLHLFCRSRCYNSSYKNNRFILGHTVHTADFHTPETQGRALFCGKANICTSAAPFCASAYPPQTDRHTSCKRAQNRGACAILVLWLV